MPTLNTLVNFNLADGWQPYAQLIIDGAGNLFGTTETGGTNSGGTIFEVVNTATGYATSPPTLISFNNTDGAGPLTAGVIEDANGNLFGTTEQGGAHAAGTVYELAKTANGYAAAPIDLVSLISNSFANPVGGLIVDPAGDLITAINNGTLVKVARTAGGYASTATTLVTFKSGSPNGELLEDASGDLFGMTQAGGPAGAGTIFEVPYNNGSYAATPTILVNFTGANGATPSGGLIMDAAGNLFGSTAGGTNVAGTVFELAKTATGWATTPTVLVTFNIANGQSPMGTLLMDAAGNIFSTTEHGGSAGDGTVFEVAKTAGGYASTPATLANFNGANGSEPYSGLVADAAGNLFGTTLIGGTNNDGTVFELSGTGFQVASSPNLPAVTAAYLAILRIAPTAAFANQIAAQIDAGQTTLAAFETSLTASEQTLYTTLPALVTIDAYYNATPTSATLTTVAASSGSPSQIGGFYAADYLHNLGYSDPNVWTVMASQWGADPTSAFFKLYNGFGSNYSGFISAVYQREFGFAPSAANLQTLVNDVPGVQQLLAGGSGAATPIQVVSGIYGYLLYVGQTTPSLPTQYATAANAFLLAAANGTVSYGPELTQEFPPATGTVATSAMSASLPDPNVIAVTASNATIDPGPGSHTIQFMPGAGADSLVEHAGGVDQVAGFDPATDILDLRSLLTGTGLALTGDVSALSSYLTISDFGGDALLHFDATGHGGGATVAVLRGLGDSLGELNTRVAQGVVRIGYAPATT